MCDNHKHAKLEEWVTPINSRHLSSKMVHLFPADHVHEHTTGPGREEVLVVLFGSIVVTTPTTQREYFSGETCFIPEDTAHRIDNTSDAPAQYCYVATKKPAHVCGVCGKGYDDGHLCFGAGKDLCLATL